MMRRMLPLALLCVGMPALAQQTVEAPETPLRDPVRERAARDLMATIRCVQCQGQSIADSNADIALTMRALIRERIARGDSAATVRDWLIARYGTYITYDPPFEPATAILWLAPIVLLGLGVAVARMSFRRS